MREMFSDARLVATKDLRIEARSRVLVNQVAPFALLVLVLFGFALDADQRTLRTFAPGLFWVTVLLAALLAVARSASVEHSDDAHSGLRLSGMSPSSIFLGKAAAVFVQLMVLEVLLTLGIVVLYGSEIDDPVLMSLTAVAAAVAVATMGTLYAALASGLGARETLLPILLLPVLAPVLIGATRAFDDALGAAAVDGWAWLGLLAVFGLVATVLGALAHGAMIED
ncbi:MAG: heme exporter protein CcmB [Acidimicrobiia bacterium]|nr:heme exporter protein CcmB [Actinomycetota bacterium]MBL6924338.1 heme exporter protein CcmB [Acidimicrobiia bacterium]MBL6926763.1 heme exporter protein CcmB [Acidimicrobiia bacterium]